MDLCKHDGRYFIYLPANPTGQGWSIYAIWADDIRGPWSAPVDLRISGCIDPYHVVGEDGRRYLFVNGIRKIRLTDDGLTHRWRTGRRLPAVALSRTLDHRELRPGRPEAALARRLAVPYHRGRRHCRTGNRAHGDRRALALGARALEHCPHNPLVRTQSTKEPWWSRGHATLVEGPAGDWWMVYHGYENGFRTLGRQTLLEPMEWTADGWFRATGGDLSRPLPKPRGAAPGANGHALSGPLAHERFGVQWCFHQPRADEMQRVRWDGDTLVLAPAGTSPADAAPLTCIVGDRAYSGRDRAGTGTGRGGRPAAVLQPEGLRRLGLTTDTVKTLGSTPRNSSGRGSRGRRRTCACG